jgi:hypothetical protein
VTNQANGRPGVYGDETCGVGVDLDPVPAEGGNRWDVCGASQTD